MIDKKVDSFVQSLCMGRIEEEILFPYPTMKASERELVEQVSASIDQLLGGKEKEFRAWDVKGELPPEFIEELRSFGLFGVIVPEAHGGLGFGSAAYSRVLQQVLGSVDQLLGPRGKAFREWDVKGELPAAFLEELRAFGLFGLVIPEAQGGLGFDQAARFSAALYEAVRGACMQFAGQARSFQRFGLAGQL